MFTFRRDNTHSTDIDCICQCPFILNKRFQALEKRQITQFFTSYKHT